MRSPPRSRQRAGAWSWSSTTEPRRRHADRVALLKDGALVAVGSAWDVLTEETVGAVFDHPVGVLPHP